MPCRVSDAGAVSAQRKASLASLGIDLEEGGHDRSLIETASLVVKSPGIPSTAAPVQWAREAGIEVIGELEFASRHTDARIAAVTGTNGKTTTTALLHHLLRNAGIDAGCAGNIGTSFAGAIADAQQRPEGDHAIWVVEASSFQLEDTHALQSRTSPSSSTSRRTTSTATAMSKHTAMPNGTSPPVKRKRTTSSSAQMIPGFGPQVSPATPKPNCTPCNGPLLQNTCHTWQHTALIINDSHSSTPLSQ